MQQLVINMKKMAADNKYVLKRRLTPSWFTGRTCQLVSHNFLLLQTVPW
jgi:hypothetical protein